MRAKTKIGEAMVRKPETLNETDTIAAALNRMSIGRYRHVSVKVRRETAINTKSYQSHIAHADW